MKPTNKCLFCDTRFIYQNIIYENKYWFAIKDGYPLTNGHTLIIPKRHVDSIFNIKILEIIFLIKIIRKIKNILDSKFNPLAYNIGINDGLYAGQTISHLHIHIIPRYKNDGGLPCGIRNIFNKEKANYLLR